MKVTRAYGKLTEIDHDTITLYDEKDLTFKSFTYDQTKIDSQECTKYINTKVCAILDGDLVVELNAVPYNIFFK
jgi:hypothetical protein